MPAPGDLGVNSLMAGPTGATAVDARATLATGPSAPDRPAGVN